MVGGRYSCVITCVCLSCFVIFGWLGLLTYPLIGILGRLVSLFSVRMGRRGLLSYWDSFFLFFFCGHWSFFSFFEKEREGGFSYSTMPSPLVPVSHLNCFVGGVCLWIIRWDGMGRVRSCIRNNCFVFFFSLFLVLSHLALFSLVGDVSVFVYSLRVYLEREGKINKYH